MQDEPKRATAMMVSDYPTLEQDPPSASPLQVAAGGKLVLVRGRESAAEREAAVLRGRVGHGEDLPADSRIYDMVPDNARGETRANFTAETWVAGPEAFVFRCQDPRRGDRWTFCISRATLQELEPQSPFKPVAAFDALRSRIHSAASARMRVADPMVQQVLSAYDIRYARTGARRDEADRRP